MLTSAIVLSLAAAGSAAIDFDLLPTWAEFGIDASRSRSSRLVEIGTIPRSAGETGLAYWLRLTERSADGTEQVRYTDTRACAAASSVIAAMEELQVPSGRAPHNSQVRFLTLDGAHYTLRMPVDLGEGRGEVSLSSNIDTPLAAFVDESLVRLEKCWSVTPPAV